MCVTLGFFGLALAVFAAECDLGTTDFHGGVGIQLSTGQRALDLGRLACCEQLMVGLGGKLGGFLGESCGTIATAEIDLGTLVISCLVFQSGLAGNRAGRFEWFGLFFGGESHKSNSHQGTAQETDITK